MQIQKFKNLVFAIRKDGKCLETIKILNASRFQFPCKTKHYLPIPSSSRPAVFEAVNTSAATSSQNMTRTVSDTDEYWIVAFEEGAVVLCLFVPRGETH